MAADEITTYGTLKHFIFTYGTLKHGFHNHRLIAALSPDNAVFLGRFTTLLPFPLVCGPFRVPFLLPLPSHGRPVTGELYSVSDLALSQFDDLEGTQIGHYDRCPVTVVPVDGGGGFEGGVEAEAYFANVSYADRMWRRSGCVGLGVYSEKEAEGYVKRADRPKGLTFLQQIEKFVECEGARSGVESIQSRV